MALRPFPGYGLVGLAAVTLYGTLTVAWSPGELDSALGLLLFVQMFLVSTGFVVAAHRGHFDPVLVRGHNRTAALAAHWCVSMVPGALAWVVVFAAGLLAGSPGAFSAATGTRLGALFIVSAVGWSAGYALPRGAAGVLWMGVLVWLLLRHPDLLAWAGPQGSPMGVARAAAAIVVCPFLVLGPSRVASSAVIAAAGAALVSLLLTWRLGTRLDVYLVERS